MKLFYVVIFEVEAPTTVTVYLKTGHYSEENEKWIQKLLSFVMPTFNYKGLIEKHNIN